MWTYLTSRRHVLSIKPGKNRCWWWHFPYDSDITTHMRRSIFSLSFQCSATSNIKARLPTKPHQALPHTVARVFVASARNTQQKNSMRCERKNLWERKNFCVTSFMTILITCWHSLRFPPGVLSKREKFAVSIFGTFCVCNRWRVQWKFN